MGLVKLHHIFTTKQHVDIFTEGLGIGQHFGVLARHEENLYGS